MDEVRFVTCFQLCQKSCKDKRQSSMVRSGTDYDFLMYWRKSTVASGVSPGATYVPWRILARAGPPPANQSPCIRVGERVGRMFQFDGIFSPPRDYICLTA